MTAGDGATADTPLLNAPVLNRKVRRYGEAMSTWDPAVLEALIEEATVDAYGEDEQLTGFFTMIGESLAVQFTTTVLGVCSRRRGERGRCRSGRGRARGRALRTGVGPTGHRNSGPAALKKITDNISGYVAEAVARQIRHQLLGADLRSHTDEQGPFSEEELAEARARIFGTTQAAGGASAA